MVLSWLPTKTSSLHRLKQRAGMASASATQPVPHKDTDSDTDTLTRLPVELIAIVFELATIDDRQTACSIAQVCRQARLWTQPMLYRVVTLTSYDTLKTFAETISSNPSIGKHIQHLWVGSKNPHPESATREFYLSHPKCSNAPKLQGLLKITNPRTLTVNWRKRQEKAIQLILNILQTCPNLLSLAVLEEAASRLFHSDAPLPFSLRELTSYRGIPSTPSASWSKSLQSLHHLYTFRSPWRFAEQGAHLIENLPALESIEICPISRQDEPVAWIDIYWCAKRLRYVNGPLQTVTLRVDDATASSGAVFVLVAINRQMKMLSDVTGIDEKNFGFIFKEWVERAKCFSCV